MSIKKLLKGPYKASSGIENKTTAKIDEIISFINGNDGEGSYKEYIALLNQSSTDAPTSTIIKNTLGGTPVWTYDSTGYYILTLEGAFPIEKTIVRVGSEGSTDAYFVVFRSGSPDSLGLFSSLISNVGNGDNDILYNTSIEIRVYN